MKRLEICHILERCEKSTVENILAQERGRNRMLKLEINNCSVYVLTRASVKEDQIRWPCSQNVFLWNSV
jgi:hypothetical protein